MHESLFEVADGNLYQASGSQMKALTNVGAFFVLYFSARVSDTGLPGHCSLRERTVNLPLGLKFYEDFKVRAIFMVYLRAGNVA